MPSPARPVQRTSGSVVAEPKALAAANERRLEETIARFRRLGFDPVLVGTSDRVGDHPAPPRMGRTAPVDSGAAGHEARRGRSHERVACGRHRARGPATHPCGGRARDGRRRRHVQLRGRGQARREEGSTPRACGSSPIRGPFAQVGPTTTRRSTVGSDVVVRLEQRLGCLDLACAPDQGVRRIRLPAARVSARVAGGGVTTGRARGRRRASSHECRPPPSAPPRRRTGSRRSCPPRRATPVAWQSCSQSRPRRSGSSRSCSPRSACGRVAGPGRARSSSYGRSGSSASRPGDRLRTAGARRTSSRASPARTERSRSPSDASRFAWSATSPDPEGAVRLAERVEERTLMTHRRDPPRRPRSVEGRGPADPTPAAPRCRRGGRCGRRSRSSSRSARTHVRPPSCRRGRTASSCWTSRQASRTRRTGGSRRRSTGSHARADATGSSSSRIRRIRRCRRARPPVSSARSSDSSTYRGRRPPAARLSLRPTPGRTSSAQALGSRPGSSSRSTSSAPGTSAAPASSSSATSTTTRGTSKP